jgi:hypothetical protein
MIRNKFKLAHNDEELLDLVNTTDHNTLAVWAIDCAERVLPHFEGQYPKDPRPRKALEILREWIATGVLKMAVIRKASLDSHAAAREAGDDSPARSAARAAGQAVATAHVPRHAYGAAVYAQQAVFRAADPTKADAAAVKERDWQYRHLRELRENTGLV